jgi:hypothetical protein
MKIEGYPDTSIFTAAKIATYKANLQKFSFCGPLQQNSDNLDFNTAQEKLNVAENRRLCKSYRCPPQNSKTCNIGNFYYHVHRIQRSDSSGLPYTENLGKKMQFIVLGTFNVFLETPNIKNITCNSSDLTLFRLSFACE